jgi:hypothetical protein
VPPGIIFEGKNPKAENIRIENGTLKIKPSAENARLVDVTVDNKPPVSQSCPNGICIGGDNSGNPAVYNFGPPTLPPLQWTISAVDVIPPIRSDYKHEKDITVTPNIPWSPVSVAINCDAELGLVFGTTRLGGAFNHNSEGVSKEDKKVGYVYFDSPTITPEVPLIIKVFSNSPFSVLSINRAKIGDLPN